MKTQGMEHQLAALRAAAGREYFAYFMEQGTGKTWTILADAEREYAAGRIDALFVLAPNGVHTNWTRREIPTHLSGPYISRSWRSGGGKAWATSMEQLFSGRPLGEQSPLRILSMNIEAICTDAGFRFALRFLRATRAMIAVDESTRIKSPSSLRFKRAMRLRPHAAAVRLASGKPNPQSPLDFFGQMEFMRSGLLGTTSYRAFVAEYADLVDMGGDEMRRLVQRNPRAAFAQIVAKDPVTNEPMYRNLDKLAGLVAKHSFRVLKKDCLDLPDKVYQQAYFELAPQQREAYALMEKERRIVLSNEAVAVARLGALTKLQQITSGFVLLNGSVHRPPQLKDNPRLAALLQTLEDDPDAPAIVWARFREELRTLESALTAAGRRVVSYHGDVGRSDREAAVDRFQSGDADVFLGQPQAGGIGLTLTRAELVVYYSNDFNLETRAQSEDRAHRIGQRNVVRYVDVMATNTIDEAISRSLQRKERLSAVLLGDGRLAAAIMGLAPRDPESSENYVDARKPSQTAAAQTN